MINLDECECATACIECEDCYVAKCECECVVEAGLKKIPEEEPTEDKMEGLGLEEEDEEKNKDAIKAEDLGIKVAQDRMPEY